MSLLEERRAKAARLRYLLMMLQAAPEDLSEADLAELDAGLEWAGDLLVLAGRVEFR